ncbi:hypothetical protein A2311_00785 [candidate division WOR-1 bacterium RIFOXYB2_FULL_48_7]|uniref:Methyltransferase domain-containing protein n=1 Tax=candidate division WOR-1 bacterium RIFOXYB2_FULL_48_7 TaxID=1802583 RepID=A0A1F4TJ74_UNCSA|nr:MAG: hypothetical protein A2311_00785 [candidate division WOR-1 bacterium RIFOXYB2_FULL_48_7]
MAARYYRSFKPQTEGEKSYLRSFVEHVRQASSGEAVTGRFSCNPSAIRFVTLREGIEDLDPVRFVNIAGQGVFGIQVWFPYIPVSQMNYLDYLEDIDFEMSYKPFSYQQQVEISWAMPFVEPYLDDVTFLVEPTDKVLNWHQPEKCMAPADILAYHSVYHPLILREIAHLGLPKGALVCDPACGDGYLISEVHRNFPSLRLAASDVSSAMASIARRNNPDLRGIHVNDASELSYLHLGSVSLFIFCGLLNDLVVSKSKAEWIMSAALEKARADAFFIITGKTMSHFDADELLGQFGLRALVRAKWHEDSVTSFYTCIRAD